MVMNKYNSSKQISFGTTVSVTARFKCGGSSLKLLLVLDDIKSCDPQNIKRDREIAIQVLQ